MENDEKIPSEVIDLGTAITKFLSAVQMLDERTQKLEQVARIQQGAIEALGHRAMEHEKALLAFNEWSDLQGRQTIAVFRCLGDLAAAITGADREEKAPPSAEAMHKARASIQELERLFALGPEKEDPNGSI